MKNLTKIIGNNFRIIFSIFIVLVTTQGCGSKNDNHHNGSVETFTTKSITFFGETDGDETVTKIHSDFKTLKITLYREADEKIREYRITATLSPDDQSKLKESLGEAKLILVIPDQKNCTELNAPTLFEIPSDVKGFFDRSKVSGLDSKVIKVGFRKGTCDQYYDIHSDERSSLLIKLNEIIDRAVKQVI